MRRIGVLAAAVWALASAVAAGPQQFDLVCDKGLDSFRLSVDLPAKTWCEQPCVQPQAISRVLPGIIHFEEGEPPWFQVGDVRPSFFVNRATGGYFRNARMGSCEAAPFTPIPPTKF